MNRDIVIEVVVSYDPSAISDGEVELAVEDGARKELARVTLELGLIVDQLYVEDVWRQ